MIADGFEDRCFVALAVTIGEFDQCLDQLREERIADEPRLVQEGIDLRDITGLPELHQAMCPVDQGYWAAANSLKPEGFAFALVPATQTDLAAGALALGLVTFVSIDLIVTFLIFVRGGLAACTGQDFEAVCEVGV